MPAVEPWSLEHVRSVAETAALASERGIGHRSGLGQTEPERGARLSRRGKTRPASLTLPPSIPQAMPSFPPPCPSIPSNFRHSFLGAFALCTWA